MVQAKEKAISARVFGMVQGVGFRYATLDKARRLGVKGYVRNMTDGSVEVIAEGSLENIDTLLAWLQKGPPGAMVKRVDSNSKAYQGFYRSFTIEF